MFISILMQWATSEWIGCLTSQLTIFQSYMWRHIDVQADWRRSLTYGRAPNAIDISQGSLTCPSQHRHGSTLFIRWFRHTPHLVAFYDHAGDTEVHILDLTPRALTGAMGHERGCRTRHFFQSIPWIKSIRIVASHGIWVRLLLPPYRGCLSVFDLDSMNILRPHSTNQMATCNNSSWYSGAILIQWNDTFYKPFGLNDKQRYAAHMREYQGYLSLNSQLPVV